MIRNIDVKGFCWSREKLAIKVALDSFYILFELRNTFARGGYNAYTIGMNSEYELYELEYMQEIVSDHEAWKKFVESQAFIYKLICSYGLYL